MPTTAGQTSRYALLSLLTALLVLVLKLVAWRLTDSIGLFSDALETLTNVGGALMALIMLRMAEQPPDDDHAFGHDKAEYFASGFEGMLIFAAAVMIVVEAGPRLLHPRALDTPALGLGVVAITAVLNAIVARIIARAGRRHESIALTADAHHLMVDVWTTIGVIVGVGLAAVTGWHWLDAAVAMLVAVQVLWTGLRLVRDAFAGLMDAGWPAEEQATLRGILDEFRVEGSVDFHAVRTRRAAARRFVSFHMLVPGAWTVQQGHDLAERVEQRLVQALPNVTPLTHIEPLDDPRAYVDQGLDRPDLR